MVVKMVGQMLKKNLKVTSIQVGNLSLNLKVTKSKVNSKSSPRQNL